MSTMTALCANLFAKNATIYWLSAEAVHQSTRTFASSSLEDVAEHALDA